MTLKNNHTSSNRLENNGESYQTKIRSPLNKIDIEIKNWTKIFLNQVEDQNFLIFKDDFDLENLKTEDLKKFRSFAKKWLVEAIALFNFNYEVSVYLDAYNITKKLQLTGFRKNLNSTLQLFFNFKSEYNDQEERKLITINFEIFSETKNKFINFFNGELQPQILKYREVNFNEENAYKKEWKNLRVDFFWKIFDWILCIREMAEDFINKINQKFSTNLTNTENFLFVGWNVEDYKKSIQIKFNYQRFDVQLIVDAEFSNLKNTDFHKVFNTRFEKRIVEILLKRTFPQYINFDYLLLFDNASFYEADYMKKYLHIYNFFIKICRQIEGTWNMYFTSIGLNLRINSVEHDFNLNKVIESNSQVSNLIDIKVTFSTIQNNNFTRIFRIKW